MQNLCPGKSSPICLLACSSVGRATHSKYATHRSRSPLRRKSPRRLKDHWPVTSGFKLSCHESRRALAVCCTSTSGPCTLCEHHDAQLAQVHSASEACKGEHELGIHFWFLRLAPPALGGLGLGRILGGLRLFKHLEIVVLQRTTCVIPVTASISYTIFSFLQLLTFPGNSSHALQARLPPGLEY